MNDSAELFGDPSWYDLENPAPSPRRLHKVLLKEERQVQRRHPERAEPPPSPTDSYGAANGQSPPQPGRAANGRFVRGNKCGTGNPFARQVAGLRKALLQAVTEEDMQQLARTLLEQALQGSTPAAKLLLTYVLGKPTEMPDPDRLNLDDYKILLERFSPLREDWDKVRERTPVEGIIEAGHMVADLRAQNWRDQVLEPETEADRERKRAREAERAARQEEAIDRAVAEAKAEILGLYAQEQSRFEAAAREAGRAAGLSAAAAAQMADAATQAEYPTRKRPSPDGGNGAPKPPSPDGSSGAGAHHAGEPAEDRTREQAPPQADAPSANGETEPGNGGCAEYARMLFRPGWKAWPRRGHGNGTTPPSTNGE